MNLDAKNSSAPATPVVSHPNPLSDLPDEVDALVRSEERRVGEEC